MSEWTGFLLVMVGGIMQGTFFLGLKHVHPWKWENIWALFSVFALVVFPMALAVGTIPHLADVFSLASNADMLRVLLWGAGWGIGGVLSGLGVARLGMALGVAVLIGITAALGSFIPLVVNNPEQIFHKKGLLVILSVLTLLVGVAFTAAGGKERDRSQAAAGNPSQQGSFTAGLTICIFSGIFSSMLNYAFAFGQSVANAAVQSGASPSNALNAVWMIALAAGFVANGLYTAYLLTRNKTWANYALPGTTSGWLVGLGMALLWTGGVILYGRGAASMGQLGSVIGWPLFMATLVMTSSIWGFVSGEWKGASVRAKQLMVGGLGVLVVASALLGIANHL